MMQLTMIAADAAISLDRIEFHPDRTGPRYAGSLHEDVSGNFIGVA